MVHEGMDTPVVIENGRSRIATLINRKIFLVKRLKYLSTKQLNTVNEP